MKSFVPSRFLTFSTQSYNIIRNFASQKTGKALLTVPKVELTDGKVLYLLISIYIHGETLFSRTIIRGRGTGGKPHTSIYGGFKKEMEELCLCSKVLGGGMMNIDEEAKKIKIFGKCTTFGRANHYKAKSILKSVDHYKDFKITVGK